MKLSLDTVQQLFKRILFSDEGTSARVTEERVYMYFVRLLNESEGITIIITIVDIVNLDRTC